MLVKKLFIALATAGLASLTASQGWAVTATTSTSSSTTSSSSTSSVTGDVLVSRYTKLTGSTANATSLVTGLRTGSAVTLTSTGSASPVTFTPTTKPMGYGNIKIALSLAKTTLAKQGITNPTPEQLAAALNGGKVTLTNGTVVTLAGVLTQRSAGMGWGKIAQASGVKLGSVVSASQTEHALKEDKKITLVKAKDTAKASDKDDNSKHRSATGDDSTSHVKGSSSSSSSANSHSSGGGSHSSNSGGSKSSSGGGNGGGNSGGNSGGNGGGNSGGNGGGGKK